MAESNVVDLTEGTRTLLRALQGRIAGEVHERCAGYCGDGEPCRRWPWNVAA